MSFGSHYPCKVRKKWKKLMIFYRGSCWLRTNAILQIITKGWRLIISDYLKKNVTSKCIIYSYAKYIVILLRLIKISIDILWRSSHMNRDSNQIGLVTIYRVFRVMRLKDKLGITAGDSDLENVISINSIFVRTEQLTTNRHKTCRFCLKHREPYLVASYWGTCKPII